MGGWSNKEKKRAADKRYYEQNRERISKVVRTYYDRVRSVNPMIYNLRNTKCRCKKQGIPFNIDLSDLEVPEYCPYLGIKLLWDNGLRYDTPSIDRIIPELGYVKGNVQVISHQANIMKNGATIEQLLTFADNVKKLHGENI